MTEMSNKCLQEDMRMVFNSSIEDIKFTKSRQWLITYYLLSLFVAIISFSALFPIKNLIIDLILRILLSLCAFMIVRLDKQFINQFDEDIIKYRGYIADITKNRRLSKEFSELYIQSNMQEASKDGLPNPNEDDAINWYKSPTRDVKLLNKLRRIISVGFLFVIVYLWGTFFQNYINYKYITNYSPSLYLVIITISGLCFLIGIFIFEIMINLEKDFIAIKNNTRKIKWVRILIFCAYILLLIGVFLYH